MKQTDWAAKAIANAKRFADSYRLEYIVSDRQLSAMFEIGCFHALVDFYSESCTVTPKNLRKNQYRYLTSPSGNPENFSWVGLESDSDRFELRQQVRVRSHIHEDICFTPDLVVLREDVVVDRITDSLFAGGKRGVFSVSTRHVIAAHECKSMTPFPELLVGFLGMYYTAHRWLKESEDVKEDDEGLHLAPTLFVGGNPRSYHVRMLSALSQSYCLNIVTGMHRGSWDLLENSELHRLTVG